LTFNPNQVFFTPPTLQKRETSNEVIELYLTQGKLEVVGGQDGKLDGKFNFN